MREASSHQAKNGGWIHRLDGQARPLPLFPRCERMTTLAPAEQRDRVYRALRDVLGLSASHREHLLGPTRGLPERSLHCFATVGPMSLRRRRELAVRVAHQADCSLAGVAGFYRDGDDYAFVNLPPGFLVPVPDSQGRIQGYQIRLDNRARNSRRFAWLSSRGWPAGTSSGAPVAVWQPEKAGDGVCYLTEGSLKALIAATHLDACVVAVAGVSNWRLALPTLEELGVQVVVIAYDQDDESSTKALVEQHREDLAIAVSEARYTVRIASWSSVKGFDDAVLAGQPITVEEWRRRAIPHQMPGLHVAVEQPAGVPLTLPTTGGRR